MELGSFTLYHSPSLKLDHVSVNEEEEEEEEDLVLGFVSYTHGLGRKRVESLPLDPSTNVPLLKRQRGERMMMMISDEYNEKSAIESLPQDVLIRIICGVKHDDLKQLFNVSKSIREATVIAKKMHFAYSTPTKLKAFRTSLDLELDDIEAPNAPTQWRSHRSINKKKLSDITVALFV
ncbi:putative Heteroproteinous nuclear ribonucleoprotein U-like protein 1 [Hibiscus syriacus]|uniref:Heteroproteinous nuclear ribonucleoprotein U-like protein 1 n=1 Tax=Hibiscus syriacus TaxID=106335 RepID=A0A6A3CXV1_HIBSY|nr:F-box protein SKIP27-like [Hibiscus syriacus]XP_039001487.1 F-box protein SKIP27-like [Hibiscus syriacus]KAE8733224.1 putative Heteroproteinous nuclear ribonucleoprotein U-like protein 1 [Hibiscus syriacus]